MNETELDKALAELETVAETHSLTLMGEHLDMSDDLSMDTPARIRRIADYLQSMI